MLISRWCVRCLSFCGLWSACEKSERGLINCRRDEWKAHITHSTHTIGRHTKRGSYTHFVLFLRLVCRGMLGLHSTQGLTRRFFQLASPPSGCWWHFKPFDQFKTIPSCAPRTSANERRHFNRSMLPHFQVKVSWIGFKENWLICYDSSSKFD